MAKKQIKTKKQKIIITICIILIVLSVIGIGVSAFFYWKPFDNQSGDKYDPTKDSNYDAEDFVSNEDQINFLVLGLDESKSLSDVIIVASFDVKNKSVEVLQIPRDSYVSKTSSTGKINSIYNGSGSDKSLQPVQRTIKVIYEQFKIPIDYYAVIDLPAFRKTVDAMGGIPINLPNKLYIDPGKILPAGEQILNGEKAEWLVRHRSSYAEGDIGRIKAQRLFMASAVQKLKTLGVSKIVSNVIPQIYDSISSNMAVKDMMGFAKMFFDIDMDKIRIHMVPGEAATVTQSAGRQSVWAIHKDSTAKMLNEYFRPYSPDVNVSDLAIIDIKNTGDWYEDTDNNFGELIDGVKPGQKNPDSSSTT